MKYILTSEQSRLADSEAMNFYGISSLVLMENAARSSAEIIIKNIKLDSSVLILCGSGNNGGDGFAVARHLYNFGIKNLRIVFIGNEEKMSTETYQNYSIAQKMNIEITKISTIEDNNSYSFFSDVIIEALIGVGGNENLKGLVNDILEKVNKTKSFKVAIDVPAGLNSNNGFCSKNVFKSDLTITMFSPKLGMYLNDGKYNCGKIETAYLGAGDNIVRGISNHYILEEGDLPDIIRVRQKESSKFDYGRVLIIAGSDNMPGATALCANASIKSGAGLVELITTSLHPALLPEIMPTLVPKTNDGCISSKSKDLIIERCHRADVIVLGPGLGKNKNMLSLIDVIINNFRYKKMVIDADALRVINSSSKPGISTILTPHFYEFCFMTGMNRFKDYTDLINVAKDFARKLNCVILLKGHPTIITNGQYTFLNPYGNPGMATAGSGDVLSGIISSFLALDVLPIEAAAVGAFVHSKSGDIYIQENTMSSLSASNLIANISKVRF